MLHIEVQKGKERISNAEYVAELRATAACTKRLVSGTKWTVAEREETEDTNDQTNDTHLPGELWLGDSWFTSVKAVNAIADMGDFIRVVKTAHSNYPKKFLEQKMKQWPSGSHFVMEAITPEGK